MTKLTVLALVVALLAFPLHVAAQGRDGPAALVAAHEAGVNAGDVEAGAAPFADDAIVVAGRGRFVGKAEILGWVRGLVRDNAHFDLVGERQVTGDKVSYTRWAFVNLRRDLGDWPTQTVEAVVKDGKIASFTATFTPESLARTAGAQATQGVVDRYFAALNAGDLETAVGFFADNVVLDSPLGRFVGLDQARQATEGIIAGHVEVKLIGTSQVDGDRVVRLDVVALNDLRQVGIEGVELVHILLVHDGKISSAAAIPTPEGLATFQQAQARAVAYQFIDRFNAHDVEGILALLDPDFIDHDVPPGQDPGIQGAYEFFSMLFTAAPDVQATANLVLAEGDNVVSYLTVTGTQTGGFFGLPPSGRSFSINGVDIIRVVNGKAVERWGSFDQLGLLMQLGVIPPG